MTHYHPQRCLHSHICKWNKDNYQDCINTDCASHRYAYSFHQSEREKVLDELDVYAEACRSENEIRGRQEKDEIIVSALAGAALAFEGMRAKIEELRKQGEQR